MTVRNEVFEFTDDLGPAKVLHLTERGTGLRAVVVVDNVAAGPAIGGVRMAPDVTAEECFRLARAMTLKNAAAAIPHGGGKSVIQADPKMPTAEKQRLVRAFASAIADTGDYIPGPDMGTDELCMAWIKDEIGRSVGLPPEIGGIPLDVIGATGFGLAVAVDVAKDFCGLDLNGARVAVQGFGSVGCHAARFLAERGACLVATADSKGSITDPAGIDIEALAALKRKGKSVVDHCVGTKGDPEAVVDAECEIWIPAARPDVIRADNVERLRAKLVVEGANIPVTAEAETLLQERGILVVPDFIANAGGVICAAVEYQGGTQATAFAVVEEKVRNNTKAVLEASREQKTTPREAAESLARERVKRAMATRRWS